jgi:hypothetical protein
VQGYTDLVRDHYANFHTSTNVGMEFVRKNEMVVKNGYQQADLYQFHSDIFLFLTPVVAYLKVFVFQVHRSQT